MEEVADAVVRLGRLALQFGRTNRATYHEDGETFESDTDHTVMLALIACAFAAREAPELDLGKVAQFALVHDLVEVYAGDTNTLKPMSVEDKEEKMRREHAAFVRIRDEFGATLPWIPETIAAYESLTTPEARFIKTLDKSMPHITRLLNGQAETEHGTFTVESLRAFRAQQHQDMIATYAHDQPTVMALRRTFLERLFDLLP